MQACRNANEDSEFLLACTLTNNVVCHFFKNAVLVTKLNKEQRDSISVKIQLPIQSNFILRYNLYFVI